MKPTEEFITLSEAAKHAPGRPTTAAVWRWARQGVKARSGTRVFLRHVRVGGRIFTRPDWLGQFFAATAQADVQHFLQQSHTDKDREAVRKSIAAPDLVEDPVPA